MIDREETHFFPDSRKSFHSEAIYESYFLNNHNDRKWDKKALVNNKAELEKGIYM